MTFKQLKYYQNANSNIYRSISYTDTRSLFHRKGK